jgi:hypothetical protein
VALPGLGGIGGVPPDPPGEVAAPGPESDTVQGQAIGRYPMARILRVTTSGWPGTWVIA